MWFGSWTPLITTCWTPSLRSHRKVIEAWPGGAGLKDYSSLGGQTLWDAGRDVVWEFPHSHPVPPQPKAGGRRLWVEISENLSTNKCLFQWSWFNVKFEPWAPVFSCFSRPQRLCLPQPLATFSGWRALFFFLLQVNKFISILRSSFLRFILSRQSPDSSQKAGLHPPLLWSHSFPTLLKPARFHPGYTVT